MCTSLLHEHIRDDLMSFWRQDSGK